MFDGVKKFLFRFTRKMANDHVRAFSAEASFFIMMSFFPIIMLVFSILQYTTLNEKLLMALLDSAMPVTVTDSIAPYVSNLFDQKSFITVIVTVVTALWAAGKCIIGMTDGINSIYRMKEEQNYIRYRIRASLYALAMIFTIVISATILVFGYDIATWIIKTFPHLKPYSRELFLLPTFIAIIILFLIFAVMYAYLPKPKQRFLKQLPGAAFTAVSWSVFSYLFSIYVEIATRMSLIYGGLTTLVVVMLWLYMLMYLFFIGAEINHYISHPEMFL